MAELTLEQKSCIEFFPKKSEPQRHLIIEAGAGAGKTQVLTERIFWLLNHKNPSITVNPSKLFVVTFSKDAAKEIAERVEKKLLREQKSEDLYPLIHISTIDSFFAELVQCIYPTWWGNYNTLQNINSMPPKLQLINENIVCQELDRALTIYFKNNSLSEFQKFSAIDFILSGGFKKGYQKSKGTLENLLSTMCSENFLSASEKDIRISAQNVHPATMFLLFDMHKIARDQYEKRLLKGELTYADKTVFLKENLKSNIPIQIQELIVDEYQDTNHIQHAILSHLVKECQARMVVVGDPKQSIYGFRSASVDVFQNLKKNEVWKHIELKKNFRSTATLLNEINKLANITFSWNNPTLPSAFINSYFFKESLNKYIDDNPLEVGNFSLQAHEPKVNFLNNSFENYTIDYSTSIFLVSASLNSERLSNSELIALLNAEKTSLKDYAITYYAHYLKSFKDNSLYNWSDFVFLCETNKDALYITEKLKAFNIPIKCSAKNAELKIDLQELNVALALAKSLAFESDSYDLYEIMQSSLSPYSHTETENYFVQLKNGQNPENNILKLIHFYQNIAKDNFYKAWQLLRWSIVDLHVNQDSKLQASVFCAKMDPFAKTLISKLSSPSFNCALLKKIDEKIKKNTAQIFDYFFPDSIENWDIHALKNEIDQTIDALEVKTVHASKGLQWKIVCFLPNSSNDKSGGKFTVAQSSQTLDISWLQDDDNSLSVLKRIKNIYFTDEDHAIEYKKDGSLSKVHWFAKLRNKVEKDFERQRVFYTAFTRAQSHLILFQPIRGKKKGIRDNIHELKSDEKSMQKFLEIEVFLKYLDSHFMLRTPEKIKGKGSRSLPTPIPPEPWFQEDENIAKLYLSKCHNISYYEFGPKFYSFYKNNLKLQTEISTDNKKNEVEQTFKCILGPKIEAQSENIALTNPSDSFYSPEKEDIHIILAQLKLQRMQITKGILYHAAAENRKSRKSSVLNLLERNSYQTFHELEIWSKREAKLHFLNSSRNILDFLSFYDLSDFLKTGFEYAYDFAQEKSIKVQEAICDTSPETTLALIVDFKTGKKDLEHLHQIRNYMNIINKNSLARIDVKSKKDRHYLIMSALCYNKNVDENGDSSWEDLNLPKRQLATGETLYLFK
ncbi:UvrD-helicase domain-containing protein [Fluviispira sanaruensis]|uniref:DNA 3'-5' helicase n=1 Tax=Fluviispira sanaruensis TaxID=2493639 RepID=A0A4P2VMS7_FLUSA|nr:UvrD-helicase domain-containing protein [Fluviispira sanaruensis]BBH53210.1 DNA helicase UvrD [Fluviispira sanaruensis]